MKTLLKFLAILFIMLFGISTTFSSLSDNEKVLVARVFSQYEKDISNFDIKEQLRRVNLLIDNISKLQNTSNKEENQLIYDILDELNMLATKKIIELNSRNKYAESPEMKAFICKTLGICNTNYGENVSNETYFGEGMLEVSVDLNSTNEQIVPSLGIVPAGKFYFGAFGGDISIDVINLKREGLGNSRDVKRVYFERDGTKVSNTSGVSSDGFAYLTFNPAIVIKQGSTISLDLMVELDGTNGGEHRFTIASSNDVQSQDLPRIIGDFPVKTGNLRSVSYSLSSIDVSSISGEAKYSPTGYNISAGRFSVSASSGQEEYEFKGITLRNTGDADSRLIGNIKIFKNGVDVSSYFSNNGREFEIKLYDLISAGSTVNYEIKLDTITCKGYGEYEYYEDEKYYKCEDLKDEIYKFEIRNSYNINITDYKSGLTPKVNLK